MKKATLLLVFLFMSFICFAGQAELFEIDEEAINREFSSLTQLENFVVENNYLSLDDIISDNSFDLSVINTTTLNASAGSGFVFEWEGFLWGFLCCPIGFFVIAINEFQEYDQKLSYWIGVAATTIIGGPVVYVRFYP